MKGYTPNFNTKPKSELNSKSKNSFIELGVKTKCDENCECEKCKVDNTK